MHSTKIVPSKTGRAIRIIPLKHSVERWIYPCIACNYQTNKNLIKDEWNRNANY